MSTSFRVLLVLFATADLLAGLVALLWPGVVEEWLHPRAMATTFRLHQWLGVAAIARGVVGFTAARRSGAHLLGALALLWAVPVPADLLLAWNTADTGPYTALTFGLRALVGAAWALALALAARGTGVADGADDP